MRLNAGPRGCWLLLAGLLHAPLALAYLDPATGSMILQGIIGAIAAAIVVFRLYWYRFKAWLNRLFGRPAAEAPKAEDALSQESSSSKRE